MEALFDFLDAPLKCLPDELLDLPEPLPKPIEAYRACVTSAGSSGYGLVSFQRQRLSGTCLWRSQVWPPVRPSPALAHVPLAGSGYVPMPCPREDKVKEHVTKNHSGAFGDKDEMATKLTELPRVIVSNNGYIDLCGVAAPAQQGHITEPVLPAQTRSVAYIPATRKRAADGDLPERMKRRKMTHPASPLKPIDLNKLTIPAASSTILHRSASTIPSRKAELLKEYLRNDKLIRSAPKRNAELRRTIQKLGAEEQEALRKV